MTIKSEDRLLAGIEAAIQSEIAAIAEEEIATAIVNVEHRVREKLGAMSIALLSYCDIARMGQNIVITVRDMRDQKQRHKP